MSARDPQPITPAAPWLDERIAPNGKPVCENFATWFARSRVIDDAGMPLAVYHGGQSDITAFQPNDDGIFFAKHPDPASAYAYGADEIDGVITEGANVTPVYLSLQNPLVTSDEWLEAFAARFSEEEIKEAKHRLGGSSSGLRDAFVDSEPWARELVTAEAKRLGHDGMILPADMLPVESLLGDWDEQPAYAVFHPEQIKSAISNTGDYDPSSASLTDAAPAPRPKCPTP